MGDRFQDEVDYSGGAVTHSGDIASQRTFVARVYGLMFAGLLLTGITAILCYLPQVFGSYLYEITASRGGRVIARPTGLFWGALIAELLVWGAYFIGIHKASWKVAGALFFTYAFLNGVVFSVAFVAYTAASVAAAFLVTSGMFGIFALFGHFTKKDLTSVGMLCWMGVVGVIFASLVNALFFGSPDFRWLITIICIPLFVGLIAWDAQMIRQYAQMGVEGTDEDKHMAIFAAFNIYINFINLLWQILRLLGSRK